MSFVAHSRAHFKRRLCVACRTDFAGLHAPRPTREVPATAPVEDTALAEEFGSASDWRHHRQGRVKRECGKGTFDTRARHIDSPTSLQRGSASTWLRTRPRQERLRGSLDRIRREVTLRKRCGRDWEPSSFQSRVCVEARPSPRRASD